MPNNRTLPCDWIRTSSKSPRRRDGRAVECTGLENQQGVTAFQGSNPCLSANYCLPPIYLDLRCIDLPKIPLSVSNVFTQGQPSAKTPASLNLLQYLCSAQLHTSKCIFKKIKDHENAVLAASLSVCLVAMIIGEVLKLV